SLLITTSPRPPLFPYTTLFRSGLRDATRFVGRHLGAAFLAFGPAEAWHAPAARAAEPPRAPPIAELAQKFPCLGAVERTDGQERSEEHTSELQSRGHLVCRLLL